MNALAKLQQSFAADLWDPNGLKLEGVILDGTLPAKRLLQVYRNNCATTLCHALAAVYPVVERLVGDEFFAFLANRFVRLHPSQSGDLSRLGQKLAEFLFDFQPASALPYLPDIARLEWAYHLSYHAAPARLLNPEALAGVPAVEMPQLRFALGPSSHLLRSDYPIFEIWKVNQVGYEGAATVDLDAGGESLLVMRRQLEVELQRLQRADFEFLSTLAAGASLGQAVDTALSCSSEFQLQAVLAKHLGAGVLVAPDID